MARLLAPNPTVSRVIGKVERLFIGSWRPLVRAPGSVVLDVLIDEDRVAVRVVDDEEAGAGA